jgi:hypothetical protein
MPEKEIRKRGGAVRWRTIVTGHGKNRKTLKVAVVRKSGKRGGHTVVYPAGGKK